MGILGSIFSSAKGAEEFAMKVENVFYIHVNGGLSVLTGTVTSGKISVGDLISVKGNKYKVFSLESLRKEVSEASSGQNIGITIQGAEKTAFNQGDLVTK